MICVPTMLRTTQVLAIAACLVFAPAASAQQRGNSGLPPSPGNPLADLQRQIDELRAGGGGGSDLMIIRGAVNGFAPLRGEGFSVQVYNPRPGDPNCAPRTFPDGSVFVSGYEVRFDQEFDEQPTVTLGMHGRPDRPHILIIDDSFNDGGITSNGFRVAMLDAQSNTCASQPFEFMAIGRRPR